MVNNNNKKMESRLEGCDSRLNEAEQHIAQLGDDVNSMKNDFVTLKSLLAEFMTEFRSKNKGEGSGGHDESHHQRRDRESEGKKENEATFIRQAE